MRSDSSAGKLSSCECALGAMCTSYLGASYCSNGLRWLMARNVPRLGVLARKLPLKLCSAVIDPLRPQRGCPVTTQRSLPQAIFALGSLLHELWRVAHDPLGRARSSLYQKHRPEDLASRFR